MISRKTSEQVYEHGIRDTFATRIGVWRLDEAGVYSGEPGSASVFLGEGCVLEVRRLPLSSNSKTPRVGKQQRPTSYAADACCERGRSLGPKQMSLPGVFG